MTDFNSLTASQLGDMIGQGKIDPVELTEHFLSQIELSPIGRKIYSTVTFKLALEQAKDSKKRGTFYWLLARIWMKMRLSKLRRKWFYYNPD